MLNKNESKSQHDSNSHVSKLSLGDQLPVRKTLQAHDNEKFEWEHKGKEEIQNEYKAVMPLKSATLIGNVASAVKFQYAETETLDKLNKKLEPKKTIFSQI